MELALVVTLLFKMLAGHALADYALQNDFIAQAKNHTTELGKQFWRWVLPSHGLIHGLMVYLATGMIWLGIIETVVHTLIDYLKCAGKLSFNEDQLLHVLCKVAYVAIIFHNVPYLTGA